MMFLNYFHQKTLTSYIIKRTIKENYKIRSEPIHLYYIIIQKTLYLQAKIISYHYLWAFSLNKANFYNSKLCYTK